MKYYKVSTDCLDLIGGEFLTQAEVINHAKGDKNFIEFLLRKRVIIPVETDERNTYMCFGVRHVYNLNKVSEL